MEAEHKTGPDGGVEATPQKGGLVTISAVVITRNEEARLARCLESVKWMDEIVVVDSGSSDKTQEVARQFTDRVFVRPFDNYATQKNFAVGKASGDWVFSLDADEVVTPGLRSAIEHVRSAGAAFDAYATPRYNVYFGRPVPHVMGTDEPIRLFKRQGARFEGSVHEKVTGLRAGRLNAPLEHFSCQTYREWMEKYRSYVRLDAAQQYQSGRRFSWCRLVFSPARVFAFRYFGLQGWRDGWAGLAMCWEMAASTVRFELILTGLNSKC